MKTRLWIMALCIAPVGTVHAAAGTPALPKLEAKSYLLMDFHTGQVLAENQADARLEPASLTKIMTTYVVGRALEEGRVHLDDPVTISEKAWRMTGSRMFIEVGKQVPLRDLLLGVIVQSGNDASVALAEHIAGSEPAFADRMNRHAQRLGLSNSRFLDTSGLAEAGHYSSARDLATLSAAVIRDLPDIYPWFRIRELTYNGIKQGNRNRLLARDPTVDGLKTGHTEGAGYCLVASAQRRDMRLIAVVLGAPSDKQRFEGVQALLNYGFGAFETHRLFTARQALARVRVWKGAEKTAQLGLSEDLYITVPRQRYQDLKASADLDKDLTAPVSKGRRGGTLKVMLGKEELLKRPLVLLDAVAAGGLLQRLADEARLLIR
ncbi:MAG: D-alanyl-D-alanine carboxypeptidase family protein [Gammaproteobacteria bacterium]